MSEIRCAVPLGRRGPHRRLLGYLDRLPGGRVKVRAAEGIEHRLINSEPLDEQQLLRSLAAASFTPNRETPLSNPQGNVFGVLECARHGEIEYSLEVLRVMDRDGQLGQMIRLGAGHGHYRGPTKA